MPKVRRKAHRPGAGRIISRSQYDTLFRSYLEYHNLEQAARDAGINIDTAKKYIIDGTERFPAIRQRVEKIEERAYLEQDEEAARTKRFFHEQAMAMAHKLTDAVARCELVPQGVTMVGDDGQALHNKDGVPYVAVDENTFKTLVTSMRELALQIRELSMVGGVGQPSIVTNVGIRIDHEAVRGTAIDVTRSVAGATGVIHGTGREQKLREMVREEAGRRVPVIEADDAAYARPKP